MVLLISLCKWIRYTSAGWCL